LNQRIRREQRRPNRSWRVDETYVKVAGDWAYLYRAVDFHWRDHRFHVVAEARPDRGEAVSTPRTIRRRPPPRVINVDGHPAYPSAVAELKQSGELGRHCRCRTSPYMNNIIEQDHRFIKKRITASLGFRSVEGACRTIDGYEAMHAIRKGQIPLGREGRSYSAAALHTRTLRITA
jgi:transposase-like protein